MPHSKKGKEERTMEPIGGVVIPSCGSSFIHYCPGNNPAGADLQRGMKKQALCSPCWGFRNHTICLIERLFEKLNFFNIKELNQ